MMTRDQLKQILERDMPGWEIPDQDLIFYEKGGFSIILKKGNKETAVVIRDGKVEDR